MTKKSITFEFRGSTANLRTRSAIVNGGALGVHDLVQRPSW